MGKLQTLADLNPRKNSIGFIRLAAASLVIVGHSFPYGGFGGDPLLDATNNQLAIGRFPVDVFFSLSGFLIAMSFARTSHWAVFAWHRFLRIYPALLVCLLLTALLLAPLFGAGPAWWYLIRNAPLVTGVSDMIPGMFTDTPGSPSVNSSLWTLPWEIRAYLLIGLLGVLRLLQRKLVVLVLFLVTWAAFIAEILAHPGLETSPAVTSGLRLLTFFMAGVVFYTYRDRIPMANAPFIAAAALLAASVPLGVVLVPHSAGLFYMVAPIPLTYAVFWLGMRLPFPTINTRYDFSYGIYVYGTLVLNVFAALGLNSSWWPYFLGTSAATLILAVLSWYFIEKPTMALKSMRLDWSNKARPRIVRHGQHLQPQPVGSGSSTVI